MTDPLIMSNYRTALFLLTLICFSACRDGASEAVPATAEPPAKVSATPDRAKIKTYQGRGKVTKIDLKLVSAELDHEEIEGLMPAMRMEFYVREKSELEALKVGDEVEFVLEDNAGAEKIISIRKIQ
jgi:Cu/Ag efflux protein CusF